MCSDSKNQAAPCNIQSLYNIVETHWWFYTFYFASSSRQYKNKLNKRFLLKFQNTNCFQKICERVKHCAGLHGLLQYISGVVQAGLEKPTVLFVQA